jgi:putative two-component system response regulator
MAMEIAYNHHERWDGSGYPRGLNDGDIPLAARIVALVDAYDAMVSRRPYKPAVPHELAVKRIAAERGAHFDPMLVDTFLRVQDDFHRIGRELGVD